VTGPAGELVAIEIDGLRKMFGDVAAVCGISLTVRDGSFTSLLGPSGSGKTTTLMMIAGFETPSAGSIRIHGREMSRTPPNARGLGMVFQSYALFPHMTVFENVAFALRVRRTSRLEIEASVRDALTLVGLDRMGARFPKQLSGGQQQRVALARALVFRPRVLLMDEPLGALDRNLREQMQGEIKRIQRQLSVTVVYVTHNQAEALSMSDTIVVMRDGSVEQFGPPDLVYRQPRNSFVARFLGETNIVTLEPEPGGQGVRLAKGPAIEPTAYRAQDAKPLASLRPEDIELSDPMGGAEDVIVRQTVFLGDSARVEVEYAGGLRLWTRIRGLARRPVPHVGERVRAQFRAEDLVLLDEE
jgi:putative spermidine/putrescine transport system ATP-binding protein